MRMGGSKSFDGLVPKWTGKEQTDKQPVECIVGGQLTHMVVRRLPYYITEIKSKWDFMTQGGKLYCRLFDYYKEADEILLTMILVLLERENEQLQLDNDCVATLHNLLLNDTTLASSARNCKLECVGNGNYICRSQ